MATVTGYVTVSDINDGADGIQGQSTRLDIAYSKTLGSSSSGGTAETQTLTFSGSLAENFEGAAGQYEAVISGELEGPVTAQTDIQAGTVKGFIPPAQSGVNEIQTLEIPSSSLLRTANNGVSEVQTATIRRLRDLRGSVAASVSSFSIGWDSGDGFTADEVAAEEVQQITLVGSGNTQDTIPPVEAVFDIGLLDGQTSDGIVGEQGLVVPAGTATGSMIDCSYFGTYSNGSLTIEGRSNGFKITQSGNTGFVTVSIRCANSDQNTTVQNFKIGGSTFDNADTLTVGTTITDTVLSGSDFSLVPIWWAGSDTSERTVEEFWLQFYIGSSAVEIPMRQGAWWVDSSQGTNSNQLALMFNNDNTDDYSNRPWLEGWNQTGFTGNGGTNPANAAAYALRTYFSAVSGGPALVEYGTKGNWIRDSDYLEGSTLYINGSSQSVTVTGIANAANRTSSLTGFVFSGIIVTLSGNISKTGLTAVSSTDLVDNFTFATPAALSPQIGVSLNGITPIWEIYVNRINIDRGSPKVKWSAQAPTGVSNSPFTAGDDEAETLGALRSYLLNFYTDVANQVANTDDDPMTIETFDSADPRQATANGATFNTLRVDSGAYGDLLIDSYPNTINFDVVDSNGLEVGYIAEVTEGAAESLDGNSTTAYLVGPDGTNYNSAAQTWSSSNNGAPQAAAHFRDLSISGWTISGTGSNVIFTNDSNGEVDGEWSVVISNGSDADADGTLSYVQETTTEGVDEETITMSFNWSDFSPGTLQFTNGAVLTAEDIASDVLDHINAVSGVTSAWTITRTNAELTFTALTSGPNRETDFNAISNNGNFINSQFAYNQITGVNAEAAETLTVSYVNPDGTNPSDRTFTGPSTFASIFNQIRNDISATSNWTATGVSGEETITVTNTGTGPIDNLWEINTSGQSDIIETSNFVETVPGEDPIATGESVTLTLDDPISGNDNVSATITASTTDLDAEAIASLAAAFLQTVYTSGTDWQVTYSASSPRAVRFESRSARRVEDTFIFSSSDQSLVPTVNSLSFRQQGVPATSAGSTTFTFDNPDSATDTSVTLTNTGTTMWDSVEIANQLRTALGNETISGWTVEDTAADNTSNVVRFVSDTNRSVGALWTATISNSNNANASISTTFDTAQAGSPGVAAETLVYVLDNGIGGETLTGPMSAEEVAEAIAENTLTGFTITSEEGVVRITDNTEGGSEDDFNFTTFTVTSGSTLSVDSTAFTTVVTPAAQITTADRTITVTDDRGVDYPLPIYGPKTSAEAATFVLDNLEIPGWTASRSGSVVTYTADVEEPKSDFSVTVTGAGGGSTLAVVAAQGTEGVTPTYTGAGDAVYATVDGPPTRRDGDIYRAERVVTWTGETEPAISTTFSDYDFYEDVGQSGVSVFNGLAADVIKVVELFQAGTTTPAPPSNANGVGFNTSTGEAETDGDWVVNPGTPPAGQTLYRARRSVILRGGETAWRRNGAWSVSSTSISGVDGTTGADGSNGISSPQFAERRLFTVSPLTTVPTVPPSATIDWSDSSITITNTLWTEDFPAVSPYVQGEFYTSVITFFDGTGEETETDGTGGSIQNFTDIEDNVRYIAGDIITDGSVQLAVNGSNIMANTISTDQISDDYEYQGNFSGERITSGTLSLERLPGLAIGESLTYEDSSVTTSFSNLTADFDGVREGTRFLVFVEMRGTLNSSTDDSDELVLDFEPVGTNVEFDHSIVSTVNAGNNLRFSGVATAPVNTFITTGTVSSTSGSLGYRVRTAAGTGRLTGTVGYMIVRS